jgi:hypothetical protein
MAKKLDRKNLPFVKEGQKGTAVCFWSVESTDNWSKDNLTGARYAALVLQYMKAENPCLLSDCVKSMIRKGKISGIEVGFLEFMGRVARCCSDSEIYQILGRSEYFNQIMNNGTLQNMFDNAAKNS